jgi:preprotein translocase subunit SecA
VAFESRLRSLRAAIGRDGLTHQHTVQALAAATEAARRGLGLEPYDTQIHAALIMLDNRLAEMATGRARPWPQPWQPVSAPSPGHRYTC